MHIRQGRQGPPPSPILMPQTSTPFSGLATNLAGGLRLCLFRSLAADRFRFGADTMALLLLFYLLASLATDYLALAPDAQFNTYAAQGQALRLGLLISALFIAWRSIAPPLRIDRALVVLLSPAPFFWCSRHCCFGSTLT